MTRNFSPGHVPSQQVVDAVHEAGGAIFPQLWHVGAVRKQGTKPNGKAMSKEDIDDVIQAFADGAQDAKVLGFDGVEIHGAHGYLLDQFLWEGTNQRDDEYGGSLENRLRFVVEIVKAVRGRMGPDFPVMLRFSQWKQQDYEAKLVNSPEELEQFLKPWWTRVWIFSTLRRGDSGSRNSRTRTLTWQAGSRNYRASPPCPWAALA
jgi:2,4-dienoyl-CoA reductase-like NADH-dependent reductase (Old Yellow Enzyme family)